MADTERGVVFTLKTKVGDTSAFTEIGKQAASLQDRLARGFEIGGPGRMADEYKTAFDRIREESTLLGKHLAQSFTIPQSAFDQARAAAKAQQDLWASASVPRQATAATSPAMIGGKPDDTPKPPDTPFDTKTAAAKAEEEAASARALRLGTNLKAMHAWEEAQSKFEDKAEVRRQKAGERSTAAVVKEADQRTKAMEREAEKAEKLGAKAEAAEQKRQADLAKWKSDVRVRSNQLADRYEQDETNKAREAQAKLNDSVSVGVEGILKLTRATALFGLVGEEDFGKVRDTVLSVQAAVDVVRGGIDVARSFGAIRGAAGAAGAASGVVRGAAGVAGATGSAAGAAGTSAGGASALASVVGPFASALGPATIALGALAGSLVVAKKGLDTYDDYDKRRRRADAITSMGGMTKTQYGTFGGPDSPFGLGIGGVAGSEDPSKATGRSGGALSRALTIAAQARRKVLPGFLRGPLDSIFGGSAEEREGIEANEAKTGAKLTMAERAMVDAREKNALFDKESRRLAGIAEGRRFGREAREPFERDEDTTRRMAGGTSPSVALAMAEHASRQRLLGGDLAEKQEALGRVQGAIGKAAMGTQSGSVTDRANAAEQVRGKMEEERNLQREILGLNQQQYEVEKQTRETAIDGVRQRIALEKTAYQGRKSDAQHFSELDPFQQAQAANFIKRIKAGEQLSLFERRQAQGLGVAGLNEVKDAFGRQQQEIGDRDARAKGVEFSRSGSDVERFNREENERALTPELRQQAKAAGGRIDFELGGELKLSVDFQSSVAKQLAEQMQPAIDNLSIDIKDAADAAMEAARQVVENSTKNTLAEVRKMIQADRAAQNNQGRVNAR